MNPRHAAFGKWVLLAGSTMRVCLGPKHVPARQANALSISHLHSRDQQISEKLSCWAQNMTLPCFWVRPGSVAVGRDRAVRSWAPR